MSHEGAAMIIGIDASRAATAQRTGTETYSQQLLRAMPDVDGGHRFRLYSSRPLSIELIWPAGLPANVEPRVMPFPRLWTHVRLSGEMLVRSPDVLFVPAHVLPLIHPRRSVTTVHDLGFLRYPEAHTPSQRRYLQWSTGWSARNSRRIIADSAATRRDLIDAYRIESDKIRVVHLGRDDSLAPVKDASRLAAVRERYGIDGRYLLYVGTIQPRKNLARLIDAFAAIAGDRAALDVQLILAGKPGWLYDDLQQIVQRHGLETRVRFPGYVDACDLPALISGAAAFVFPSLYEGFGLPVIEAQSCGVPVMTSNNSSLPEIAGDSALLVDPHDVDAIAAAMKRLIEEPELRAELTRRGFENVKRFSWEKCARETLAVLEEAAT